MRGGATASDAVITAVMSALGSDGFNISDGAVWKKLLTDVDAKLARTMAGETTAIIAVIGDSGITGVSCGDSQAWVISETGIDDLTADQKKKRLGSGHAALVAFYQPRLDGTLVIATDGLWDYTWAEKVAEVVRGRAPGGAAEELQALVRLPSRGYSDDVGVVVVAPLTR